MGMYIILCCAYVIMVVCMVRSLDEMREEAKFWWTCSFCGEESNVGTDSLCKKCSGVRKTA